MAAILLMWPGLLMYTLVPPSYRCFVLSLALIGQAVSEKKENIMVIYMYIAPGWGQTSPSGSNVSDS